MGWANYVTEQRASENVRRIYNEIKLVLGVDFVPKIFMALANVPRYLEAEYQAYKRVMEPGHLPGILESKWAKSKAIMSIGKLKRTTKELIAVAVSAVNACEY